MTASPSSPFSSKYQFAHSTHLPIEAVADSRSTIIRQTSGEVSWASAAVAASLCEALAAEGNRAVILACPDAHHGPLAIEALEADCHVLVDKPLAPTLRAAGEAASVATRCDRMLSVFQNRRWDDDFPTLRSLLAAGELGDVIEFESCSDRFRPESGDRWKDLQRDGVWFVLGAHLVDQGVPAGPARRDLRRPRVG